MSLELDLSKFTPQMELYVQVCKSSEAEALNKKAADVAYRAAQFTPVATAQSIKASLNKDAHLLAALTSIRLKQTGRGILPKPQFRQAMGRFVKYRMGAKKYLRSGWAPLIEFFGRTFRGGASGAGTKAFFKKTQSHGMRATPVMLVAELTWVTEQPTQSKADGAEAIAFTALQKAVDYVAEDMGTYIERQIAKGWD